MKDFGLRELIGDARDYILGDYKLPYITYNQTGDWENWLPEYEPQKENFETYGCTVWGTQNAIETFHKFLYGTEPNYSERFTCLLSGLKGNGGTDPNIPCESIRKDGLVDNRYMPMTHTKSEFFDINEITGSLRARGQQWLVQHEFKHEWVWKERPTNYMDVLKETLKTSPIGVSVTAWTQVDGVYISDAGGNNHWCMLYKFDEEGYPWVFDSYNHSKKKLSKDHNIRKAKRIWINKKTKPAMHRHIGILEKILKLLMNKKTLLQVVEENIGKDVTPVDMVSDEVACAEVATTLVKKVYPSMPLISGTWTLWKHLTPENGWILCAEPEPECLILSPTGSVPKSIGHVGIVLEDGVIASNDSRTGKLLKNYTIQTWHDRYSKKLGMPVYYYKHK